MLHGMTSPHRKIGHCHRHHHHHHHHLSPHVLSKYRKPWPPHIAHIARLLHNDLELCANIPVFSKRLKELSQFSKLSYSVKDKTRLKPKFAQLQILWLIHYSVDQAIASLHLILYFYHLIEKMKERI